MLVGQLLLEDTIPTEEAILVAIGIAENWDNNAAFENFITLFNNSF